MVRHPTTAKGELRQTMHLGLKTMWKTFEINLKSGRDKKTLLAIGKS